MTIEKRGSKYRIKQMVDGKYYYITVDYKPTKKEAELLIAQHIGAESEKSPLKGSFEYYGYRYLSTKDNAIKSTSYVKYESSVRNLPEWFKEIEIKDITQEDVQKLVNEHSANHAPKTTKDLHSLISSILGMYRPNFKLNTTLPAEEEDIVYYPTDEDVKAIIKRAEGTRYEVVFNLLLYGLRRSEALAIDVKTDLYNRKEKTTTLRINKAYVLDKTAKQYYVRESNKTKASTREIEISNSLADKMIAQGFIFDGKPHMLNKTLSRYQRQLGITHFKLHEFRAYYASMMMDLGVPLAYIEASGGWEHGSKSLQKIYLYVQNKKLRERQTVGIDYIENVIKDVV